MTQHSLALNNGVVIVGLWLAASVRLAYGFSSGLAWSARDPSLRTVGA